MESKLNVFCVACGSESNKSAIYCGTCGVGMPQKGQKSFTPNKLGVQPTKVKIEQPNLAFTDQISGVGMSQRKIFAWFIFVTIALVVVWNYFGNRVNNEDILGRLNANTSDVVWSEDPFNLVGNSPRGFKTDYLGGGCSVWVFNNAQNALNADFRWYRGKVSWFQDSKTGLGIAYLFGNANEPCVSAITKTFSSGP